MRSEWIWISADDSEAILYPIMGPRLEDGPQRIRWMQDMIGGYFTPFIPIYPIKTAELFWMGVFSHPQFTIEDISRFDENIQNLWCDEEGDLKQLPLNKRATTLTGRPIVGNILIELTNPDCDEEAEGLWVQSSDGPVFVKEEE